MIRTAPDWRAALARRLALDLPLSLAEAADRWALAARRHETWICAALALGVVVEIGICVVRSAALYPIGP